MALFMEELKNKGIFNLADEDGEEDIEPEEDLEKGAGESEEPGEPGEPEEEKEEY